jgi:hypothetical protein
MMEQMPFTNRMLFNNILYIGDEPKECLSIIEKFNIRLSEIEQKYEGWFSNRSANNSFAEHDKLQRHIHYHFEGGIAVFKFRNEEDLPAGIRKECLIACRDLAAGQLSYAS